MSTRPNSAIPETHLFVNAWVNAKSLGYNKRFVLYPTAPVHPGDLLSLTASPEPFAIRYLKGNWWISFGSSWLGYFPEALWTVPFTSADFEQWFGEVATRNAIPSTTMGDGIPGTQNGSAQVSKMAVIDSAGTAEIAKASVQPNSVTDANLYSVGGFSGSPFLSVPFRWIGRPAEQGSIFRGRVVCDLWATRRGVHQSFGRSSGIHRCSQFRQESAGIRARCVLSHESLDQRRNARGYQRIRARKYNLLFPVHSSFEARESVLLVHRLVPIAAAVRDQRDDVRNHPTHIDCRRG